MIQSIEEGRKEDGNRSIADKIIKRLNEIDKSLEYNQGRWAWELLQNAKDSIASENARTLSVQIILNLESIEFRHNGSYFSEQDIRGLINQISSKEIEEGQIIKKTGRFGTGFLTTHLLSKRIKIKGILRANTNKLYRFNFLLSRDEKTINSLIPKIENAWNEFHESACEIETPLNSYDYNTSFIYLLETSRQSVIAKIGIEEFSKLLPFVLAFNSKIQHVEIIDNINNETTLFKASPIEENNVKSVLKTRNDSQEVIFIKTLHSNKCTIGVELEKVNESLRIKSIKDLPKLFCDFPLIGTENFHFPVLINSIFFSPKTERDGIWLKGDDSDVNNNKIIIEEAVLLYKNLILETERENILNVYNAVNTRIPSIDEKFFDEAWYKSLVQTPIKEFIISAKIVQLENKNGEKKAIEELWFPLKSYSIKDRERMWQFNYDLYQNVVCRKDHLNEWTDLSWDSWNKIDFKEIVSDLSKQESIQKLSNSLSLTEIEAIKWLNSVGEFIFEDEINLLLFKKFSAIPNKKGLFKKYDELHIDNIKDGNLISVLSYLGLDWDDILVDKRIRFGLYQQKEKRDIAFKITEKIKSSNHNSEGFIQAINLLSEWFENNSSLGVELFSEIYSKRAELFMNTIKDKESLYQVMRMSKDLNVLAEVAKTLDSNPKIIDDIKEAQEIKKLLIEYNINDFSELKNLLKYNKSNSSDKIQIDKNVLASLGITSVSELEELLGNKEISELFAHTSTPDLSMFNYVQNIIARAKKNVIDHLKNLSNYDCSDVEELANTIIGGIKKDGVLIYVVVRPSDNGEVILFYNSEKDTLDYANSELWIDNGVTIPCHLTLGKIIKTTGINRIPV